MFVVVVVGRVGEFDMRHQPPSFASRSALRCRCSSRVLERGPVWELMAATGISITIPMFFFALAIQRHFIKGMNLGAVR